ncbi:ankyrin repeat domain-containing protein [Flavobacterium zepuense]|uniref:Ankyrin repeat domain-containing protein n=1 Tax=Flavobacterium zepuense TaxID=2593302 RepID=A0A552V9W6_9FLAO|nr:ankyrin repeat domain-containing protein [Flavobacterium zepuense]TRW27277.1 ankyrin repeat domain-containing protein [Flavobacterium zepuense]
MKKILFTALMLSALYANAQKNNLLDQNFWKSSPDVTAVKSEIAKGSNPAELNPMSFDPVVMAINGGASVETIKFLIDQPGNSVNKPTHDGRIYLHWAANKGNDELVQYLIAKKSDLNLEDSHGYTPIAFATFNGQTNTAVYEHFFKAGTDPKKKYKDGANLLLLALPADKDLTLSDYFVTKGLSLKDTDANGSTAFDYAARTGNIDQLKTLLKKGVKQTDNAMIFAARGSRRSSNTIEVYKYLVDDLKIKPTATTPDGQTVLHFLARKEQQAEIVNYFIAKGVDVNKADKEGTTALMNAASGKDTELLNMLIAKTKNINAVNAKGESALTQAVKNSSADVVSLLISKGADVTIKDAKGNNLAYYLIESYRAPRGGAAQKDDFTEKLNLLQQKGINLASQQKDGSTLYHTAIIKNDLDLLKKLAALKIDVNAKDTEGVTVLHKAAMISKDDAILKYLVGLGAKKDIKTGFDETAYDLAKENEVLKKNNVQVDFLK